MEIRTNQNIGFGAQRFNYDQMRLASKSKNGFDKINNMLRSTWSEESHTRYFVDKIKKGKDYFLKFSSDLREVKAEIIYSSSNPRKEASFKRFMDKILAPIIK